MTGDEIHVAWSRSIAELAMDALVTAKIVVKDDYVRAVGIAAEEIYVRLTMQDRPDRENWRYKSN
jgi:hypothetical protein